MRNCVKVFTNSIELAGTLIQDLCSFFNIDELDSQAHFPLEWKKLSEAQDKVKMFNQARTALGINMAESVSMVKEMLVRSEDSRMCKN